MNKNNGGGAMANGGEFELPPEMLSVLPSDPYEQLDVARRITAMAVAARVSKLESETGKLRQKLTEKEHTIYGLQERVVEAESTLQETSARLSHALDEQTKLANEKNALTAQVKKLTRDVAKLETFKRTLMQSLQEDDDNPNAEGGEKRGANSAIRRASQAESTVSRAQILDDDGQAAKSFASKPPTSSYSSAHNSARGTPHLSPRLTPSGSPKGSGRTSPRRSMSLNESHPSRISLPSSQSTTAPNSPPSQGSVPSRTPRVDGKDFFRQARNRLSYGQFSAFLANIKELNAHRQTREETLKKAEETFGPDNKDLFAAFDGLLSRHLPS
jgi:prefoldin subunit 5